MKSFFGFLVVALLLSIAIFASFTPPPAAAMPAPQTAQPLYCASDDWKRHYCPMDTRAGVQLYKQRSDTACLFGQTWGYESRGVWVDRGCRAEFVPGYLGGPGGPGGPGVWPGWGNNYNVYCASDDGKRNRCPVDSSGGVRLVRQRSGSPCNLGATWGYDRHGIWVDRGCRADFEIGQAGWQPPAAQTIYCASDDGKRRYCKGDTSRGVRISGSAATPIASTGARGATIALASGSIAAVAPILKPCADCSHKPASPAVALFGAEG